MDNPVRKIHPLFRLAVISGVETAVRLHIRRGDDLNARDQDGATPLILAACKNRSGIARLLLEAGADLRLVDSEGMDALAHARRAGCLELASLLTMALAPVQSPEPETQAQYLAPSVLPDSSNHDCSAEIFAEPSTGATLPASVEPDETIPPEAPLISAGKPACCAESTAETATTHAVSPLNIILLDTSVEDDWEAEEESVAPEGDVSVPKASRQVQESIARHQAVDRDEEWSDVDLHLPERATPLVRDEGDGSMTLCRYSGHGSSTRENVFYSYRFGSL